MPLCAIASCMNFGSYPICIHFGNERMFADLCDVHVKDIHSVEAEIYQQDLEPIT